MYNLYHYCSIDTLEAILKNRTIRFSSLGVVDDIEESLTNDLSNVGRICFVSCWTDNHKEDINMWRTYTENSSGSKSGVRIALPPNFFSNCDYDNEIYEQIEEEYDVVISTTENSTNEKNPILFPVTYTKDDTLIKLNVMSNIEINKQKCKTNIDTRFLGKFKRDTWISQNEWRYRIIALPKEYYRKFNGASFNVEATELLNQMVQALSDISFQNSYIDIPFPKNFFELIEVMCNPLNKESDNQRIQQLLDKYCCGKKYLESKLKVRK